MESRKDKPGSYQWTEPKWSYRPGAKAELLRILNLKLWLRIIVMVALLTVPLAYAVNRAVPNLEFNWFGALITSFGFIAFFLAMMSAVLWLIPPRIKIWKKGIIRQHGSSQRTLLRSGIRSITIDTSESTRPILRIESASRPFECGIAAKVSLSSLAEFIRETFPDILFKEKQ